MVETEAEGGENDSKAKAAKVSILKETLVGASNLAPSGINPAPPRVNYFIGNDKSKWRNNVATYNSISLGEVYKGIDLSLKAYGNTVEKVFIVQPGANPEAIKLKMEGSKSLKVNEKGELELETNLGVVRFSEPVAYQERNGKRETIKVAYLLHGDNYGFEVDDYDKSLPLIIDPVLSWNTFIGSAGNDWGRSIAVDGSGNVYVAGRSNTNWGSPVNPYTVGGYKTWDAFAAKFNSAGVLLWHTFMGSGSNDESYSVAVDGSGNVYVAGRSEDAWGSPVNSHAGDSDAFAAKLDSSGGLLWHTFMGSGSNDDSYSVAVDGSGNVYVSGGSGATWGSPVNSHAGGHYDVFAAKLDSSGGLLWHTFMGSGKTDRGKSIAVDGSGNVYVAGESNTNWGSPVNPYTVGGYETWDVFAAKLDSSGGLLWHTFMAL
jgi:hypothetical protein